MAKKEERYEEEMDEMEERDEIEEKESALLKFGEHLQKKRKEKFRTQEEFAKLLPMPLSSYSQYEQGKRWPRSILTLKRIASLLDTSIDYLLNGREPVTDTYMEYVREFIKDSIRPGETLVQNMSQGENCEIKTPYGKIFILYDDYENLMQEADFVFHSAIKERIGKEINDQRAQMEGTNDAITIEIRMLCDHLNFDVELANICAQSLFGGEQITSGDLAYTIYCFYFMELEPSANLETMSREFIWRLASADAEICGMNLEDYCNWKLELGHDIGALQAIGLPPSDWKGYKFLYHDDRKIDEFIKLGLYNYWRLPNEDREWLEKTPFEYKNFRSLFFYNSLTPIDSKHLPIWNIMDGHLLDEGL